MRRLDPPPFEVRRRNIGEPDERPYLFVDDRYYPPRHLPSAIVGTEAYLISATDPYLRKLAEVLDVEYLFFYELKGVDLTPLKTLPRLRHLRIEYAPKLADLHWLAGLPNLETLVIADTRKLQDLGPVAGLRKLEAFEFSGSMTTENVALSLEPLTELPRLAELRLRATRILDGGLTPLARCQALEELDLSSKYETSDYALLSVALPSVKCDQFCASFPFGDEEKDTMIMGKGKPWLSSRTDGEKIAKYQAAFRKLQEEHRKTL
jgi:hypothetical protein